jgi:hypothetical protein
VVKSLTLLCDAVLRQPSRAQSAQQASLLAGAGVGPALAALLQPRAGWATARAHALRALTALLVGLRKLAPEGREEQAHPAAVSFVEEFGAAGGDLSLARLLPGSPAALKLLARLVALRPAFLSPALYEPVVAAMTCRFGADGAVAALEPFAALITAQPLFLEAFLVNFDVLNAVALPLLYALCTHADGGVRAAAAKALERLVSTELREDGPRPQQVTRDEWLARHDSGRLPFAALGVAVTPGFLAQPVVLKTLLHSLLTCAAAADVPALGMLLSVGLCARSLQGGAAPVHVLQGLMRLAALGEAARGAARDAQAAPYAAQARALAMGGFAQDALRAMLGGPNPAWAQLVLGAVHTHPACRRLLRALRKGDARAAAVAAALDASAARAAFEWASEEWRDEAHANSIMAKLSDMAGVLDALTHAAAAPGAVRVARARAQLACLSLGGAEARAAAARTGAELSAAQQMLPAPDVLSEIALNGFAYYSSNGEDGLPVTAHTVGLHFLTAWPDLLAVQGNGLGGLHPLLVAALCQLAVKSGAQQVLRLADAAHAGEESLLHDAALQGSDACALDLPLPPGAAALAARGFTLREAEARALDGLWDALGVKGPPPPPLSAEAVAQLTWRFEAHAPPADDTATDLQSCVGGVGEGMTFRLHFFASQSWLLRTQPTASGHRLHRLPTLLCDVGAALQAAPEALRALREAVFELDDDDGGADCAGCPMCVLSRAVGDTCGLPGCGRARAATASDAAGDGRDEAPGERVHKLKRCRGCAREAYCCAEHSRRDWARHKAECRAAQAAGAGGAAGGSTDD